MNYRIAYLAETMVNWCPALGTVLANDEVINGVSERGGYPVEQKKMRQWCLRVSAYAQRLLDGLDTIDWTDSLKETQRNWIGRSEGTEVEFNVADSDKHFTIFTTRADTMFGVTFMVLAPESDLVAELTTADQKAAVDEYLAYVKKRTERERQMDHKVTGVFSGSYAINPFTDEKIPIWISEYVLAGYGTGAIMAVPAHDSRDYAFAKHFNLPIIPLIEGADVSEEACLRYLIGLIPFKEPFTFPVKTLRINLLGCFVIGLIAALAVKNSSLSPKTVLFIKTGLCGGFTTFSTFAGQLVVGK